MRTPKLVLVLPGLLIVGLAAVSLPGSRVKSSDLQAKLPVHMLVHYGPDVRPLLPVPRAEELTTASGRQLSCDEIRGMDEVELITDESYCGERS
jgi:hypothetical protein